MRFRLEQLGLAHLEVGTVHLVHREEGCGHAARALEELTAADAELFRGFVGDFLDTRLDLPLLVGLWMGHVLAV